MPTAEEITKKAKSNLAIALVCLPKQRRDDMVTFYAFCRVIDDIADEATHPEADRHLMLDQWVSILESLTPDDVHPLSESILEMIERYSISTEYLLEIIAGCRSDISNDQQFATWADLQQYTYRVASCVGLVSIKIFGCSHPSSQQYAENLGHALQLTNIIRDVGYDIKKSKRLYLPLEDMESFDYSVLDLNNRVYDDRFIAMMHAQSERAESYYIKAIEALHPSDRKALKASESMRKIYFDILQKMKNDDFQVFTKHYKLSKFKKLYHLLT